MDTEVLECRLTKVASRLESQPLAGTVPTDLMNELRSCENELVANRFARAKAADGRPIRVRVPAVDAALIWVSRALSQIETRAQIEQALESIEQAREEVAHIPA